MREPVAMSPILSSVVEEGMRLADAAAAGGLDMKLMGGVAVALTCPDAIRDSGLARQYKDLDFAAPRQQSRAVQHLLTEEGYEPNQRFNALHGSTRLLFYDPEHGRQLDVFLGTFNMCHRLDLESRLGFSGRTLPPSDLLLLKLQVVRLNEKDLVDALALLLQHEPGPEEGSSGISVTYLSRLCGNDWGWYTTLTDNLETVRGFAGSRLGPAAAERVRDRVARLLRALEDAPKSPGWRLRARVGRRLRWYELPEEADPAPR
jgi:hypothetical protein